MTAGFAIVLVLGVVGLLAWITMSVVAGNVEGWDRFDPDLVLGRWGRRIVAGLVGAGMAGMSATFAGWPTAVTVVASVVGGVGLAAVSDWLTAST